MPDVRALLIASNEICYNPRLLKTADSLLERGIDVSIFNTVVGLASPTLYREVADSRPWQVRGWDISKRTWRSRLNWLVSSGISRSAGLAWNKGGSAAAFPFVLNRGLFAFPWRSQSFDLIVVNLVDNLPFAARLKRRRGGVLIYDSQELFSEQGTLVDDRLRRRWVDQAEREFIQDADVVMTTTQAMADRLRAKFRVAQPVLRVRNAPLHPPHERRYPPAPAGGPVKLIWHGFAIHHHGRGVDRLLEALALCQEPVTLTLQGRISDDERRVIAGACQSLGIAEKVTLAPPAHPEQIVPSLVAHEIGVIAETGRDENEKVTSSNKLFEYLHAGLAVVAPDLPGLTETVATEGVGVVYRAGDAQALATAIDRLARNRTELGAFRHRASAAAARITWTGDFDSVWKVIEARLPSQPRQPERVGLAIPQRCPE